MFVVCILCTVCTLAVFTVYAIPREALVFSGYGGAQRRTTVSKNDQGAFVVWSGQALCSSSLP